MADTVKKGVSGGAEKGVEKAGVEGAGVSRHAVGEDEGPVLASAAAFLRGLLTLQLDVDEENREGLRYWARRLDLMSVAPERSPGSTGVERGPLTQQSGGTPTALDLPEAWPTFASFYMALVKENSQALGHFARFCGDLRQRAAMVVRELEKALRENGTLRVEVAALGNGLKRVEQALGPGAGAAEARLSKIRQLLGSHEDEVLEVAVESRMEALDAAREKVERQRQRADRPEAESGGRTTKRYVLGFVFDARLEHGGREQAPPTSVLLIRKARPEWQAGRFNGIGGKLEVAETPEEAMAREAREESGGKIATAPEEWRRFATLAGPEVYNPSANGRVDNPRFEIALFSLFTDLRTMHEAEALTAQTGEPLAVWDLEGLFNGPKNRALPNVPWMVAMALSFLHGESAQSFHVSEAQAAPRSNTERVASGDKQS
jgi:8-oxo-dGTP pyrophosphatase MutT (NUDIX family)